MSKLFNILPMGKLKKEEKEVLQFVQDFGRCVTHLNQHEIRGNFCDGSKQQGSSAEVIMTA